MRLWVEQILAAAGHTAELVRVPDEHLPDDLLLTSEISQPWTVDSTRARERLGWIHAPWRECVERSVRWHLRRAPAAAEVDPDFSADDAALAHA
ncbi:MAG TPA: hypothetical protein VJU14_07130 [Solirubrobacterales bacterium]|nr:hypothetical protein [Solirubrobacterales bacterium]